MKKIFAFVTIIAMMLVIVGSMPTLAVSNPPQVSATYEVCSDFELNSLLEGNPQIGLSCLMGKKFEVLVFSPTVTKSCASRSKPALPFGYTGFEICW